MLRTVHDNNNYCIKHVHVFSLFHKATQLNVYLNQPDQL